MSIREQFTDDEWFLLGSAPAMIAAAMSSASPGGAIREMVAGMRRTVEGAREHPDSELIATHRHHCLQVLQQLGAFGWTLATLDTLPFGFAVPLHEALQLLRDHPPAGAHRLLAACLLEPEM